MRRLRTSDTAFSDTLAFETSNMTWGSSTPGVPRSKASVNWLARCSVWLTALKPCFMMLANSLGPLTWLGWAACAWPTFVWACRARICSRTRLISMALIWSPQLSGRHVDTGLAQARELVSQCPRADAETLGRFAAVTLA